MSEQQCDKTLVKAWNAMKEAWQSGNYGSARKMAITLRPLTMPEWKARWLEFDSTLLESFGGAMADAGELEEIREALSKISAEKNRLERDNQVLMDENNELYNENSSLRSNMEKLNEEIMALRQKNEDLASGSLKPAGHEPETDDIVKAMHDLTLARKANRHLFNLTKLMQARLESLGEPVNEFDAGTIGKLRVSSRKTQARQPVTDDDFPADEPLPGIDDSGDFENF